MALFLGLLLFLVLFVTSVEIVLKMMHLSGRVHLGFLPLSGSHNNASYL